MTPTLQKIIYLNQKTTLLAMSVKLTREQAATVLRTKRLAAELAAYYRERSTSI